MPKVTIEADLQPWQYDFINAEARFPALVAGWGTGKTMAGIFAIIEQCKKFPGNECAVLRKEGVNLDRSTIQDFRRYTGDFANMQYNEQKHRLKIPTWKSTVWFLHADERATLNNLNLGAVLWEQADEIEDGGETFDFVEGRCRRDGTSHKCFVIANAVEESHWIYKYWKQNDAKDPRFALWEANSFDNACNLPRDTIESWRRLETRNPAIYKRYVLNQWGIGSDQFVLIPYATIEALKDVVQTTQSHKGRQRIISCDPSQGGDECVAWVMDNGEIIDQGIYHEKDLMVIVGHLMLLGAKHKINNYAIDTIGIGAGVGSRLNELVKKDQGSVQYICSSEASSNATCNNKRTEMWWYVSDQIMRKKIPYPADPELRRQLSSVRYKVVNSNGMIALEPKEITKKRLGCSPDRADAYVYGIWATQFIKPPAVKEGQYRWKDRDSQGSYMTV